MAFTLMTAYVGWLSWGLASASVGLGVQAGVFLENSFQTLHEKSSTTVNERNTYSKMGP
jgi:hypothetical protein